MSVGFSGMTDGFGLEGLEGAKASERGRRRGRMHITSQAFASGQAKERGCECGLGLARCSGRGLLGLLL